MLLSTAAALLGCGGLLLQGKLWPETRQAEAKGASAGMVD